MSLKKCEKCGETVDEAKAFCPECGNPFVTEEKREDSSEFDKYAGTLKMTDSAYKLMLSKMELDTSRPPEEKSDVPPVKDSAKSLLPENKLSDQNKNSGGTRWIIPSAVGALIFVFITAVILIVFYIYFY